MEPKPEVKETVRRALLNNRGDDLNRARAAFRGLDSDQLDQQHGESGKTRREILSAYERHEAEVDRALEWIEQV